MSSLQLIERDSELLAVLPDAPGVYRFLNADDKIIYVGKAKSLKKRVKSYFLQQKDSLKTQILVSKVVDIKITLTDTESEALLLEQTLIKKHKPHYNILLKDDKSYPYIFLSDHAFPRLCFHRGPKIRQGEYFGPYTSGGALREILNLLQKVFKVRQCEDSFYRNRSRPCLQHQINRCTAPCVNKVSAEEYRLQVDQAKSFLQGKELGLIQLWIEKMESASERLDFEAAANLRDQISQMKEVQSRQEVVGRRGELDLLAVYLTGDLACVSVVHVRNGNVVGHDNYLISAAHQASEADVLHAFIPQYYLNSDRMAQLPREIILSVALPELKELSLLIGQTAGRSVRMTDKVREHRAAWLNLALLNAEQHLRAHFAKKETQHHKWVQLERDLQLESAIERIECFDVSHTQGERAQASCVVFDQSGPANSRYRRFNIEGIEPGDDYAAIALAVLRRYQRQKKEGATLPTLVLIDGGKGQLKAAHASLEECQIDEIHLLSIAKGPERKAGLETIFRLTVDHSIEEVKVSASSLLLLQQVRDEAHRFAITGHRQRRDKKRTRSVLQDIPGVGSVRRKQLLTHFGGLQGLKKASAQDLAKVPGISLPLAETIVDFLRQV